MPHITNPLFHNCHKKHLHQLTHKTLQLPLMSLNKKSQGMSLTALPQHGSGTRFSYLSIVVRRNVKMNSVTMHYHDESFEFSVKRYGSQCTWICYFLKHEEKGSVFDGCY
jgi:hypothetical protein